MADVDLALVLAFDGSASVTYDEFGLMTGGCGAALRQPNIVAGMTGGPSGASLCAVLLWSSAGMQATLVDWTLIDSPAAAANFATDVQDLPRLVPAGNTALGDALQACERLLGRLPRPARRRVIDVAGDGRWNDGVPPGPVRDRLVASGTTINGLCVLHEEPDLLDYYTAEVIGGPGAFALVCRDYQGFADAMSQKLEREIARRSSRFRRRG